MQRIILFLFLFLSLILAKSAFALDIFKYKREIITIEDKRFGAISVLIADDVKKREQGLSFVKLDDLKSKGIKGMLFIFDDDKEKTFQAWYMNFDLLLLGLEKINNKKFKIIDEKTLFIGTTTNIKGKYVLEIPYK